MFTGAGHDPPDQDTVGHRRLAAAAAAGLSGFGCTIATMLGKAIDAYEGGDAWRDSFQM